MKKNKEVNNVDWSRVMEVETNFWEIYKMEAELEL